MKEPYQIYVEKWLWDTHKWRKTQVNRLVCSPRRRQKESHALSPSLKRK